MLEKKFVQAVAVVAGLVIVQNQEESACYSKQKRRRKHVPRMQETYMHKRRRGMRELAGIWSINYD